MDFPTPPQTDSDGEPVRGRARKRKSSSARIPSGSRPILKYAKMEDQPDTRLGDAVPASLTLRNHAFSSPTRQSRSRSVSPVKQKGSLQNGHPSTKLATSKSEIPTGPASRVREQLNNATKRHFVHKTLDCQLPPNDLDEFTNPLELFDPKMDDTDFAELQEICELAKDCNDDAQDEAAWCRIVDKTLGLAVRKQKGDIEVLDIRNQTPDIKWLPFVSKVYTNPDDPRIPARKSDFSLAFHRRSARVKSLVSMSRLPGTNEKLALSHSGDNFTSMLPLQCTVEVKKEGGDHLEARTQLATWHSAALCHMDRLSSSGGGAFPGEEHLPLAVQLGWVVVGHKWEPFLTCRSSSHEQISIGPILSAEMGTTSLLSAYKLLAALRAQTAWLLNDYWPAFNDAYRKAVNSEQ